MEQIPSIIALTGPTGVGKTTIGKLLAQNLGYAFVDLDRFIEDRLGVDIDWIFQLEGEPGFRRHEQAALHRLLMDKQEHMVLSTGGGAILTEANRKLLKEKTTVIYLSASVDTLMERTTQIKGRPLLAGTDRKARLQQMLEERQGIYQKLADLIIAVDTLNIHQVLKAIEDYLH